MTTIITKNSSTASAAPVAGDLTKGELAVNVTDKKLYTKDNGGSVVKLVGSLGNQEANAVAITGGSIDGTPIGGTTASTASFTTVSASGNVTLSGGTANGVAYLNGSKVVTSGSALTFSGTTFAVTGAAGSLDINPTSGQPNITIRSGNTFRGYIEGNSSGGLTFGSGPSATTGMILDSSQNCIWYPAGSEAMRLTSTGLGIGTSSPGYRLQVDGASTSGFVTSIVAKNPSTNGASASKIGFDAGGTIWGEIGASYNSNDPYMAFFVRAGSEKMRITDAGNLGLGVTPSAWNSSYRAFNIGDSGFLSSRTGVSINNIEIGVNWYRDSSGSYLYKANGYGTDYTQQDGAHFWYIAPSGTAGNAITFTQALTLTADGNLLVAQTSAGYQNSNSTSIDQAGFITVNHIGGSSSGNSFMNFGYGASGIGSITQSGTTAVAYNTSSDYRLKNTIAPMTGALAKVAQLKPVTYKWNVDGSDGEGFIAHELAEVVPQCVTGEKDAVDDNGNPKYQGIDTSFLVATLTAALQEAHGLIKSLEARVVALEAK